jgi:hypothetical protein
MNTWDLARKEKLFRHEGGNGKLMLLEPGVNFFVLMLEQLGCKTFFSCEGHPEGFYVVFESDYSTAYRVAACGYFTVEIVESHSPHRWAMRLAGHSLFDVHHNERHKRRVLRSVAANWEHEFGKLTICNNALARRKQ